MAQEVFRDVRVGPESWVEGTRVQGALGAVGTARASGEWPAGLPLGRRGGDVSATQNGKDAVLPLGWGGGHGDGRWAGGVGKTLLGAHLLLLHLQEGLLCRDRERKEVSGSSPETDKTLFNKFAILLQFNNINTQIQLNLLAEINLLSLHGSL